MTIKFEFLKVGNGDAILVKTEDCIIMIDSGEKFNFIEEHIANIERENRVIDHFILTHVDQDHIKGFLDFIQNHQNRAKRIIRKVWFNSFYGLDDFINESSNDTSINQGLRFEEIINKLGIDKENRVTKESIKGDIYLSPDIKIRILSPNIEKLNTLNKKYKRTKVFKDTSIRSLEYNRSIDKLIDERITRPVKDRSPTNGASIAFILTYRENKNFLFLGDAHIGLVNQSLEDISKKENKEIFFEFIKLSHHGSKGNLDNIFLKLADTRIYIICTSGQSHKHPNKETLARIINHHEKIDNNIIFLFNYCENKERINSLFSQDEKKKYKNFKLLCEKVWGNE
jgi:ribonuclease BN (tRNA processing enzyme)